MFDSGTVLKLEALTLPKTYLRFRAFGRKNFPRHSALLISHWLSQTCCFLFGWLCRYYVEAMCICRRGYSITIRDERCRSHDQGGRPAALWLERCLSRTACSEHVSRCHESQPKPIRVRSRLYCTNGLRFRRPVIATSWDWLAVAPPRTRRFYHSHNQPARA